MLFVTSPEYPEACGEELHLHDILIPMNSMHRERGNAVVIILGILLILFLVGFFTSDRAFWDTFNYKQLLRLPCGVTVNNPNSKGGTKVAYPLLVDGYVNGCGWNVDNGRAGSAQILDAHGHVVVPPTTLVVPIDSTNAPFYFSADLTAIAPPTTDTGSLLITSTAGLLYSIPIKF